MTVGEQLLLLDKPRLQYAILLTNHSQFPQVRQAAAQRRESLKKSKKLWELFF
jgi:hypothetical protein